jgi:DNA-binding GntR family transcriptional regulator
MSKADSPQIVSDSFLRVDRPAKTLRELALHKMREAITKLHFRPGDRLVERELCAQLGVSRTIVREVLRHLESEGLVTNFPNKGPAVAHMSRDEARQIYEIRGALEGMAARLCAEQADEAAVQALEDALNDIREYYRQQDFAGVLAGTTEFYRKLFEIVDRHVAWGIVNMLTVRINHLRSFTIKTDKRDIEGPEQMAQIVNAIRNHDGDGAHKAATRHVARAAQLADIILSQMPEPEPPNAQEPAFQ